MKIRSRYNLDLFKFFLYQSGYSFNSIAKKLNLHAPTFYRQITKGTLPDEKINSIKNLLNLSSEDIYKIFYPNHKLSSTSNLTHINVLAALERLLQMKNSSCELAVLYGLDLGCAVRVLNEIVNDLACFPNKIVYSVYLNQFESENNEKLLNLANLMVDFQNKKNIYTRLPVFQYVRVNKIKLETKLQVDFFF